MAPVDTSVSDDKVGARPAPEEGHPRQTSDRYLAVEAVPLGKAEAPRGSILLLETLGFPACRFSDSATSLVSGLMTNT